MDPLTATVAAGSRARLTALDILANNLANASTPGFKADREFHDAVFGAEYRSVMPDVRDRWIDLSAAPSVATGNPLDLSIRGAGWFVVEHPGDVTAVTRNGSFQLSPQGYLQTAAGRNVLSTDGKPIQLNARLPVVVGADGSIMQDGRPVGRLQIVDVSRVGGLTKAPDETLLLPKGMRGAVTQASVAQGRLENSNVNSSESAVRLVTLMRHFEVLQRALSLGSDMNRKATEDVARTGA